MLPLDVWQCHWWAFFPFSFQNVFQELVFCFFHLLILFLEFLIVFVNLEYLFQYLKTKNHIYFFNISFYRPGQPNWDFWQCGNLAIFMPLWFYVKSILAVFIRSKTGVLTILKALNFHFWKKFHTWKCQKFPKSQSQ